MLSVRMKCAAFSSLLFLFLLIYGTAVPAASAFLDSSTTWPEAQQSIAEMSAAGLVNGYQDGTFKPDQNVSKLEVVALLVRVLGLEDQAKSLDKTTVDYKMPNELFWGKGYLITGVQRGMLDKDYLHQLKPAAPANRAEVAVLIYHALNLTPDSTPMVFEDASVIPEAYRSCVGAVVKNKIMVGLPGNVFKPNDYITRAQMAVLLARLIENGMTNPYPGRWVTGTLVSYDSSTHQATVTLSGGTSVNQTVDGNCTVYRNGKSGALTELAAGQQVRMVLNSSGKVIFLRSSGTGQNSLSEALSLKGRVESQRLTSGEYNLRLTDPEGHTTVSPYVYQGRRTRSACV